VLIDGRRVAVHTMADGPGKTVVWCHGAPGAGNFDPDPEATRAHGITLIGVDRPGYAGSDPVPPGQWCTVGLAADDLAAVLRRRGDGPVGVAGWSSGGRVAMALAARHPDLVDRVAVVATPAPDEFVPWLGPELRGQLDQMRLMAPENAYEKLSVPPDGPAVMRLLEADEDLSPMFEAAYAQGPAGMLADTAGVLLQPWGFEPRDVRAATLLVYGAADRLVEPRHGKWWERQLPDARYEEVRDAGHLVIGPMWGRIVAHLVS
jgi:pimeloyl-ACP methyl ester carboxylesterase